MATLSDNIKNSALLMIAEAIKDNSNKILEDIVNQFVKRNSE